jgi:hypothetical protein
VDFKKIQHFSNLFIAPVLLIIIACIQIYRAHVFDQSPWKGGGFGMFSSTDAPGARFLRCYLITDREDVPVYVPHRFRKPVRLARTVPTRENLSRVAQALAASTWVPYDYHYQYLDISVSSLSDSDSNADFNHQIPAQPNLPDDVTPLKDNDVSTDQDDGSLVHPLPQSKTIAEPNIDNLTPLFRVKGRHEPAPSPEHTVNFVDVRVELWRYIFDSNTSHIRAKKWLEVTSERIGK